ncbi:MULTISPECIES: phosphoribosylanthranilate isomerase [Legionella]|uniref:phosphoribosylanthranilate isomerase n=1 Tax=Legionella TaxID=445 RepID=UPI002111AB25
MSTRIRIKMCGMMREEDVAYAVSLGVDAVGFIFYEKSSRAIDFAQVKALGKVPAFVSVVGVFVNPAAAQVRQVLQETPVTHLQFHGEESADFCTQFNKPYLKAIAATSSAEIVQQVRQHSQASAILLDTPATCRGGSGQVFDWQIIPKALGKPVILAGGLNATNVHAAAAQYPLYGVDVCSGIELKPGIKDHNKMREFVNALWGKK